MIFENFSTETFHYRQPYQIIYEDLRVPEVLTSIKDNSVYAIAFHDNGIRYLFSNTKGHTRISNSGNNTRPMTKREFKIVKAKMLEKIHQNATETEKDFFYNYISTLNFAKGHTEETMEVGTSLIDKSKINFLAVNFGHLRYVYTESEDTVMVVNRDKNYECHYIYDSDKDKIIEKIKSSKTITKKINEIKSKK